MIVSLTVTETTNQNKSMKDKIFKFSDTGNYIFGRSYYSNIQFTEDDNQISRIHFMLTIVFPQVIVKDLGSLNGTYINDKKYGGREDENQRMKQPVGFTMYLDQHGFDRSKYEVRVRNNDKITIGETTMLVNIDTGSECRLCGNTLTSKKQPDDDPVCPKCKKQELKDNDFSSRQLSIMYDKLKSGVSYQMENPELNQFEFMNELGEGGFGKVFKARDTKTNKIVAVKLLHKGLNNRKEIIDRFKREIDISSSIQHENIVRCLGGGFSEGVYFMVMDYIDGVNLSDHIYNLKGNMKFDEASKIIIDALKGLSEVHNYKIIHRDIKPSNILLTKNNGKSTAKLSDFGISKDLIQESLTQSGTFGIGTLQFMPPEQFIDFKTVTYNADIYSMGATLYYLVTGNMVKNFPPQNEMGNLDELVKIIVSPNIPVEKRNPNIPRKLAKIINKSIDIDLNNRYQSAEKFKRKLEEFLSFS